MTMPEPKSSSPLSSPISACLNHNKEIISTATTLQGMRGQVWLSLRCNPLSLNLTMDNTRGEGILLALSYLLTAVT